MEYTPEEPVKSRLTEGLWAQKNKFRKSCENKEQFFSEKECMVRIETLVKKFDEKGLVPYKCQFCGWWHFGHEIGIEKKKEIING
jgi:hypothetical protein